MSFRNPRKSNARPIKLGPRAGKIFALAVIAAAVGGFFVEHAYVRHHRPLLAAELATAEREGPRLLEEIGAPPGSTRSAELEKTVSGPNFKSKWHGLNNNLLLVATWDVPGTAAAARQWYLDHLPARGWLPAPRRAPSEVQLEWEREKWLLTIGHGEWWGGRDAHVRVRLYWHYGHDDVGRASVATTLRE